MNEIKVSFDQRVAVRISDGAELVAEPRTSFLEGCRGCAAASDTDSCCYAGASKWRLCWGRDRKDLRNIYWRLKNG